MSRSYKKYPSCGNNDKFCKKYYNKTIRRLPLEEDLNGGRYKKFQLKWNVMESRKFRCVSWNAFQENHKGESDREIKILYHKYFLKNKKE